ncbi:MAG: hypothetical protein UU80_C0002G0006 [candidate division WWE3 bacterium GW2011_GWA1_41_8]|uniref:Blue (type 1) copper domain-containing protein n=2 Tax=Katanobacteria TaxID=422282 RepID=A0A0G0XCV5_UNCKA|nr:MAG: hypothetical protein UU80_C0002G0006 [candidate division WWE3 bacterium GW2011_GWA1_41_8]
MRRVVMIIAIVILAATAGYYFFIITKSRQQKLSNTSKSESNNRIIDTSTAENLDFTNPKKSAHYETNTPAHGEILAGVPINVVIDFNFDLASPSEIKINMNGKDFGVGNTVIDDGGLSMRRAMKNDAPDGIYSVFYNACWPDGSCHNGSFQFAVNRSLSSDFSDLTNNPEVTIDMNSLQFSDEKIRISNGTKVTWNNLENVAHFINTNPHPAHSYYPVMNSRSIGQGESFSVTFNEAGIYLYHCSAHPLTMRGYILVE